MIKRLPPVLGILLAALCSAPIALQAKATQLIGTWTIDVAQTEAIQPEQPQEKNWFKNQNIRTSVSVAGMPLPNPRTKVAPISSHAPKDPDILRCKELKIEPNGDGLRFTYVDVGSEMRKQGSYRGAKIRWNKKKLTESYKSTERKVTQTYEIKDNNQLLVTVKINPYKGATRTYKQVFNRKAQ